MKIRIKNMTPHEVTIVGQDGKVIATFPSEGLIRLSEGKEKIGDVNGIPVFSKRFGGTDDVPPEEEGTLYIVSLPVAQAFPERRDFLIPDDLVRDEAGRVVGARALATLSGELPGWLGELEEEEEEEEISSSDSFSRILLSIQKFREKKNLTSGSVREFTIITKPEVEIVKDYSEAEWFYKGHHEYEAVGGRAYYTIVVRPKIPTKFTAFSLNIVEIEDKILQEIAEMAGIDSMYLEELAEDLPEIGKEIKKLLRDYKAKHFERYTFIITKEAVEKAIQKAKEQAKAEKKEPFVLNKSKIITKKTIYIPKN